MAARRNIMMRAGCMFAAAFGAMATPAHAELTDSDANSFVSRNTAVVAADKRAVWLALISPADWWNAAHTFSGDSANLTLMPSPGGCFCERMPERDTGSSVGLEGGVEHMRVILAIPDQALRMQGNLGPLQSEPVDGVLTVTLADVDGRPEATRIIFEYAVGGYMRFETPVIAKAVDNVMAQQIRGLAAILGAEGPGGNAGGESGDDAGAAEPADGSDADRSPRSPRSVDDAFGNLTGD